MAALAILITSWILARLAHRGARATSKSRLGDPRVATLEPAIVSLVRIAVIGTGVVTALWQLGVNVATVLAGAGVLGIAVGFGAQTPVRDIIGGFFLIVDDVVEMGDFVEVGQISGIVEEINLRMTRIRSFDGRLWYVPNGELNRVGNSSREWMRAVANIPLAYEQDVAQGLRIVQEVGDVWATEHEELVLEPREAQGVLGLTPTDVSIRLVVKVQAMQHWAAQRELTKRVKDAFVANSLETPFPRQVVYHRGNTSGAVGQAR